MAGSTAPGAGDDAGTSVNTEGTRPPVNGDIVAVPVRHPWRWVGAGVVLVLLGLLVWAFSQASIDWTVPPKYFLQSQVLKGMGNTLLISVLAQVIGVVLGILVAVMRQSDNWVTRGVAEFYIWLFRGTPVLVQLMIWYNLSLVFQYIPGTSIQTNAVMTPFVAALLGLGINEGAYMAEIVRSGIQSVDKGQMEAASALGMSRTHTMRRIVLPQAMRVIIPPTGNEFINMLKTSSLAYSIQYLELLQAAVRIYSNTLQVIEMLITVSAWYLILTTVFSIAQHYLERYFNRSDQESGQDGGPLATVKRNLKFGRQE
ncbi:amino acid ABC transporter permease [Raineyella sp. LH-20]|uniref:amino acid ABC transporter permease n=1 Tax=Raineyella sp. LH-20 TaxID=3081204 RepID=UPI002955BAB4|nr:amino acid ABC transporter permease [Raineyella sp. LH-20]WOP18530.1 amino acid ABC transporter permease [Raineyella sp. LH-20]